MFTVPGLKNHTVLRQVVFVDDCGDTFTIWTASTCIHGIHDRAGQGEGASRQVCGQRGRDLTTLKWPWQYHLWSCWCDESCAFRFLLTSGWSLPMTGCQHTEIRPFIPPNTFKADAYQPPFWHRWTSIKAVWKQQSRSTSHVRKFIDLMRPKP